GLGGRGDRGSARPAAGNREKTAPAGAVGGAGTAESRRRGMTCDDTARILDGGLLPEEIGGRSQLRRHADLCLSCRDSLTTFLAEEERLERHVAAHAADALLRETGRRRRRSLVVGWGTGVAA